jgi:hypothetical protein
MRDLVLEVLRRPRRSTRWLPLALALTIALPWTAPGVAHALCDVIPQAKKGFRAAEGRIDRPFASPGDPIELTFGENGCGSATGPSTDFDSGLAGWTGLEDAVVTWEAAGGNPGGFAGVFDPEGSGDNGDRIAAPAAYLGDWAALGVETLSFDYQQVDVGGGSLANGSFLLVQVMAPCGTGAYVFDPNVLTVGQWSHFDVPIDATQSTAPAGWQHLGCASWQDVVTQVQEVSVLGSFVVGHANNWGIDNFELVTPAPAADDRVTFVFTPPNGPAHAHVATDDAGACASAPLLAELAACAAELGGGGTTSCDDMASVTASATGLSLPFPATGRAGSVKIATTSAGSPLPCDLATLSCTDPGPPRICVDALYEDDSTCTTSAAQVHDVFSTFTALPPPNDFAELCDPMADPDSPCAGSEPDIALAIDAAGNALIPMSYARVLVPGEIPVPRLVELETTF